MKSKKARKAEAKYCKSAEKNRRPGQVIKSFAAARYQDSKLGKLGPASKVRKIDRSTVDVSQYLERVQEI